MRARLAKLVPIEELALPTRIGVGIACAVIAVMARAAIDPWVADAVPWITFFPAVLVASIAAGAAGGVTALAICVVAGDAWFLEPRGAMALGGTQEMLAVAFFVLVGGLIALLGVVLRTTVRSLRSTSQAALETSAALRRQVDDLTRLHEFGTRVARARDLDALLEELMGSVVAIQGAHQGFIELYDRERNRLHPGVMIGHDPAQFQELANVAVGEGNGACGTAAARRARVIVEDVERDPLFAAFRAQARRAGFRAVWSTPLLTTTGELVGVLSTHFATPQRPNDQVVRLVELYGRLAADAIEAAELNAREERARREVETALAALSDADRRKDEFLAMLAHELRNPLAPIRNAVEILRRLLPAGDVQLTRVRDVIDRQVTHLARLVDDLLEVSRFTRGKIPIAREPLLLSQVVEDAVETVRPLVDQHGHTLSVALAPEVIRLDGDRARLVQVVGNLLSNAVKFTPRGGHITLVTALEGERTAAVRIRDTGIGIPAELQSRVFDLFMQEESSLARSQGGLGIGLTLVQRLVELHGGSVAVHSEGRGHGAEFVVRLPASAPTALAGPTSAAGDAARPEGALAILVVEDNRDAAESFRLLLGLDGHAVRVAHHGVEALRLLDEFVPDIAFLDLGLPEMTGFELAERLRADPRTRDVRLIAVTGYGQDGDKARCLAAGFDRHLTKPVAPAELAAVLAESRARKSGRPASRSVGGERTPQ